MFMFKLTAIWPDATCAQSTMISASIRMTRLFSMLRMLGRIWPWWTGARNVNISVSSSDPSIPSQSWTRPPATPRPWLLASQREGTERKNWLWLALRRHTQNKWMTGGRMSKNRFITTDEPVSVCYFIRNMLTKLVVSDVIIVGVKTFLIWVWAWVWDWVWVWVWVWVWLSLSLMRLRFKF